MNDLFEDMDINGEPAIQSFQVAEGFARITRAGETDIYLVQNMNLPGGYATSFAFDLDDFAPEKNVGHPLVVHETDKVEPLGPVMEYLAPKSPLWESIVPVVKAIPRDCGLLPTVRAVEILRRKGVPPTQNDIEDVVKTVLNDYHRRRAMLVA